MGIKQASQGWSPVGLVWPGSFAHVSYLNLPGIVTGWFMKVAVWSASCTMQCCWWHCYISLFSSTLNLRSFRASPLNLKRISAHRQTCCPHVSMQVLARKKMACLYAHVQCCFSNRAQHYHLNCHLLVSADTHGQLCGQSSCSPHTLAARRDPCTGGIHSVLNTIPMHKVQGVMLCASS